MLKDTGDPQQTNSSNKDTKKATTDAELGFTRVHMLHFLSHGP